MLGVELSSVGELSTHTISDRLDLTEPYLLGLHKSSGSAADVLFSSRTDLLLRGVGLSWIWKIVGEASLAGGIKNFSVSSGTPERKPSEFGSTLL